MSVGVQPPAFVSHFFNFSKLPCSRSNPSLLLRAAAIRDLHKQETDLNKQAEEVKLRE